jgi:hypothetical protein
MTLTLGRCGNDQSIRRARQLRHSLHALFHFAGATASGRPAVDEMTIFEAA